jgi:alkylation response protein AidB-like acyl-CoA dehydrogenase
MSDRLVAATSTTGFFQEHPVVQNQYEEDAGLRRASALFLPPAIADELAPGLKAWGDRVLARDVWAHVVNAERDLPHLSGSGFSAFGQPVGDALVTSAGWQALQDIGIAEGRIVATGNDKKYGKSARLVQLPRLHLWSGSSAVVTCPSAMQDGAISILRRDLASGFVSAAYDTEALRAARTRVFKRALERMLSTDPKVTWTSGQWMTERAGGSDVQGTQTVATRTPGGEGETDVDGNPLGPWAVSGFKWFSSATDCGCVMLLAQTERGLSCFFAPTRKLVNGKPEMNGIRIQRLKNKLGTKALPTAELELRGMRAWLVGEEGRGVPVISTILNVTRYYNIVGSVAGVGRALGVVKAFARVRRFPKQGQDTTLSKIPLFNKTLAAITLQYRADVLLSHLTAALLGSVDAGHGGGPLCPASAEEAQLLLHVLTPVAKAYTAKHVVWGLQECMESLGGVGYMENVENPELNLARSLRDANVNPIWEGTTNVLSSHLVRALKGRAGGAMARAVNTWLHDFLPKSGFEAEAAAVLAAWTSLRADLAKDEDELLAGGRKILWRHGDIFCATLLLADAARDGNAVATECARRFVRERKGTFGVDAIEGDWKEVAAWDERIVYCEPAAGQDGARANL